MAETKLAKIKSIYGDLRGLFSELPDGEKHVKVRGFIVGNFNTIVDKLSEISETDYSSYTIPDSERQGSDYSSFSTRSQVGRIITRLEEEYGFGQEGGRISPSIVIFNKNQNEISVNISYTMNDIIEQTENNEAKQKLNELKNELEKSNKNWGVIRSILIWVLNFSKDIFIQLLPLLLEKKI